jgi:hypothetical protein
MSYNNQYIITSISGSNNDYNKVSGIDQIPVIFSLKGVINIREKDSTYDLTIGK